MRLSNYFDARLIYFMNASSKEEALHFLVDAVTSVKDLPDSKRFYTALLEREKIVSTGIGMGVAIPHAKLASYPDFFISIGILQKGVDWNALDNSPVRIIFLIGGPDDKQTEYLKILSSLTTAIRNETLRKKLLSATNVDDIVELVESL